MLLSDSGSRPVSNLINIEFMMSDLSAELFSSTVNTNIYTVDAVDSTATNLRLHQLFAHVQLHELDELILELSVPICLNGIPTCS